MNQAQTQSQTQAQAQSFDLIIEGVGYLNRIRLITPKKGPAYLACTINAMMGKSDSVEYVGIDCIVVGQIAKLAIDQLTDDVNAKRKVIVGFRAGDPKPDFYEWPAAGFEDTLLRWGTKPEVVHGNETAVQPGVQA